MKKYFKKQNSFMLILTIAFLLMLFNSLNTKEIRSTKEGGNWCSPNTWVSKEIPGTEDNVIIDGEVLVNCPAFADTLLVGIDGYLRISEKDSLNCHMIILDEKDGKKGQIKNLNIINVEEKKRKQDVEAY